MGFNFDVNMFIEQVANALGVATDTVIQLYPHLLKEFIGYEVFTGLYGFFGVLTIVCGVLLSVGSVYIFEYKKAWISLLTVSILSGVCTVVSYIMSIITAPNITLLLRLLEQ